MSIRHTTPTTKQKVTPYKGFLRAFSITVFNLSEIEVMEKKQTNSYNRQISIK